MSGSKRKGPTSGTQPLPPTSTMLQEDHRGGRDGYKEGDDEGVLRGVECIDNEMSMGDANNLYCPRGDHALEHREG